MGWVMPKIGNGQEGAKTWNKIKVKKSLPQLMTESNVSLIIKQQFREQYNLQHSKMQIMQHFLETLFPEQGWEKR